MYISTSIYVHTTLRPDTKTREIHFNKRWGHILTDFSQYR